MKLFAFKLSKPLFTAPSHHAHIISHTLFVGHTTHRHQTCIFFCVQGTRLYGCTSSGAVVFLTDIRAPLMYKCKVWAREVVSRPHTPFTPHLLPVRPISPRFRWYATARVLTMEKVSLAALCCTLHDFHKFLSRLNCAWSIALVTAKSVILHSFTREFIEHVLATNLEWKCQHCTPVSLSNEINVILEQATAYDAWLAKRNLSKKCFKTLQNILNSATGFVGCSTTSCLANL